jgi:hypothetical protein
MFFMPKASLKKALMSLSLLSSRRNSGLLMSKIFDLLVQLVEFIRLLPNS